MQARIKFTGHVPTDRIAEIMNSADIVLLPYRHSCGSAAVADAIEFARPTVATAVPAFCELNVQANCLRLVTPDAPFELAHAIRELAGDFNERRRMFAAARTFARLHSFAALAQQCISSLDQVVDVRQETIAKDDFALGDDDSNPRWPPIETIRR
jgi:glycosyltransferase involved in cell wall biosynthesis